MSARHRKGTCPARARTSLIIGSLLAALCALTVATPARADSFGQSVVMPTGLYLPTLMAVDSKGDVFVSDSGNDKVREITPAGVQTIVDVISMAKPAGLAVDGVGDLFVVDSGRSDVIKLTPGGTQSTLAFTGLVNPQGLAVDSAGDVYVVDSGNNRVVEVSSGGAQTTVALTGLTNPYGVAVDATGNVYVSDAGNNRVVELPIGGSQTTVGLAGLATPLGVTLDAAGDLYVTSASSRVVELAGTTQTTLGFSGLEDAIGVAVGPGGDVLVVDGYHDRIEDLAGGVQTTLGFTGLQDPIGVAVDSAGDVFVADTGNNRIEERPAGGVETTVGFSGLSDPEGLAVDGNGDVFVADTGNNRVVELPVGGAQTTLGFSGLSGPANVAVDGGGDVFVTDTGNNRVVELPTGGAQITLLSSGLSFPFGLAVDGGGNVFVSDRGHDRVLKILPSGEQAALAISNLEDPADVAVDSFGDVYVSDSGDERVVELSADGTQSTLDFHGLQESIGVAANSPCAVYTTSMGPVGGVIELTSDPCSPPGPPSVPTQLIARGGDTTASLSWAAPPANGSPITGYVVTPFIGAVAQTPITVSPGPTSYVVPGLTDGTAYTFTVAAVNALGTGPAATSNSVVEGVVPGAPTITGATAGDGSATLTWTAGSSGTSAISAFVVTTHLGNAVVQTQTFPPTATTQTISGLIDGDTYTFDVVAVNDTGTGPSSLRSGPVTPRVPTVPGAPSIGSVVPGHASAVVSWLAGTDGGLAITGYVVTPYRGSVAQTALTFSSAATSELVTGLADATTYTFKVAAINALGTGPTSAASPAVTTATTPHAPSIGGAIPGVASASVHWVTPQVNGGAAITGYAVTPYINGVAQVPQTFNSTASTEVVTGLTDGTTYTFTVAAINVVGPGTPSAMSNAVVSGAPVAPGFVTALTGAASAKLSWWAGAANAAPITGYLITPYIGGVAQTPQTFTSTASTEIASGLTNGTTYTFTVAAINALGTGLASNMASAVLVGAPSAPTIASITPGDGSAKVHWSAPASVGAGPITGYVITVTGYPGTTTQTFAGAATTEVMTGLTNGIEYQFRVAAINSVATGPPSGPLNGDNIGTPAAPGFARASAGNASATVAWSAGVTNGSPITGYEVTVMANGNIVGFPTFNTIATSDVVTGLTNGTSYTFQVAAMNANGTGVDSSVTAAVLVGAPSAPAIGTATTANASATVTWHAATANGAAITGYVVTPYARSVAKPAQTFGPTATSGVVTGLANGTTYTFKVAATNAIGTGAQSSPTSAVAVGLPAAPGFVSGVTGNASAKVSWWAGANNGSPITGYVITPYIGSVAQPAQTFTTNASSDVVTGLANGTTYAFKVAAVNAVGTGAQSSLTAGVLVGLPVAPSIGTATTANASATVTWHAPSGNGSPITGYVVTPYVGSAAQPAQTFASTATSEVVTGLTNGTSYTFKVAAINAVGTGAQSSATAPVLIGLPAAPGFASAVALDASAKVAWWASADNGSAITGYVITPYLAGVAQAPQTFTTNASNDVVTGLTNGATYTFKVAAINGVGTGAPSSMTPAVLVGTPGAPSGTKAKAGAGQATVSWTAPAANASPITGYVVTPYIGSVAQPSQTFASTATSEIVTGLISGTAYTFKVAAINAIGAGPVSSASSAVTPT